MHRCVGARFNRLTLLGLYFPVMEAKRPVFAFLKALPRQYLKKERPPPLTVATYIERSSRGAHGQAAHGRHSDAIILADRKSTARHESWRRLSYGKYKHVAPIEADRLCFPNQALEVESLP